MTVRVIDGHVHLGTGWNGTEASNSKMLAAELRKRGVEKAVAMTLRGLMPNCDVAEENNILKELADQEPEMYVPFCTVNPHQGEEAVSELRRAVKELGMRGLKLHPWLQAFSITHPNLENILEEAVRLRIPIIFHDGTPPYSTPLQICDLAERYPDATIILGHSGLKDLWKNAINCAARCDNVHLCICGTPFKGIKQMVEDIGPERMIFGSDAGFSDPSLIDFRVGQILRLNIDEEEKERILSLNIARILGL